MDDTKSQKTEKSIASQLKDLKHTNSTSFIQINKDNSLLFDDDIDHLESFEAMDMSHRDPNWGKNISYNMSSPMKKGRRPTSRD